MKILSFNVNGIRSAVNKGFFEWLEAENPDVICLQETKAQPEQIDVLKFKELGYDSYINSAEKKGYSGTAIFTKIKPQSVTVNFDSCFDNRIFADQYGDVSREGRLLSLEFADFFLLTTYVPNAKHDLSRLAMRHDVWDKKLLEFITLLEKRKPVVLCGDLNVAHRPIDLANPKQNEKNAGYTPEEREGFDNFMTHGLVDVFRRFYPDTVKYTWWSMRTQARDRNVGWRIDYFLCSQAFVKQVVSTAILDEVTISDHCPVRLIVKNQG
ncbi:MAG: exodeoxyribonuclease III [Prevotellaceae bacterium]|jgi:exodeoxyribonuclease-3|nr:exodeoxyribonuclease III [Prevotellaceae bacterium]